jgi:hypothetical protein
VSIVRLKATRFPSVLATKRGFHRHRVKELIVVFWPNEKPRLHAAWICGNSGGSTKSPLMDRPELPLCEACGRLIHIPGPAS